MYQLASLLILLIVMPPQALHAKKDDSPLVVIFPTLEFLLTEQKDSYPPIILKPLTIVVEYERQKKNVVTTRSILYDYEKPTTDVTFNISKGMIQSGSPKYGSIVATELGIRYDFNSSQLPDKDETEYFQYRVYDENSGLWSLGQAFTVKYNVLDSCLYHEETTQPNGDMKYTANCNFLNGEKWEYEEVRYVINISHTTKDNETYTGQVDLSQIPPHYTHSINAGSTNYYETCHRANPGGGGCGINASDYMEMTCTKPQDCPGKPSFFTTAATICKKPGFEADLSREIYCYSCSDYTDNSGTNAITTCEDEVLSRMHSKVKALLYQGSCQAWYTPADGSSCNY